LLHSFFTCFPYLLCYYVRLVHNWTVHVWLGMQPRRTFCLVVHLPI
jgi:hypothetical protein